MIHPEFVGTRRSPSVAKGETPLPSMSSSKDPPVPNNGHLQNHIGSHCYKYKRYRKQTPLLAPASRTRGFREDRQNNKPFKRPSCPKRQPLRSRSIWNNKLLKHKAFKYGGLFSSRSIWNNKLLKPKKEILLRIAGSRSIWNNKLLKPMKELSRVELGSRSIWNNKLLKPFCYNPITTARSRSIWNNKLLKHFFAVNN